MKQHFKEFLEKLSAEIKRELPGFSAQQRMAPLGRKPVTDYLDKNIPARKSAILILIYPDVETFAPQTALILRPEDSRHHSGQVSFPGGGRDEQDKSFAETALREAEEEVGVPIQSVTLLGELTPLYIPVSNYLVHPFVGALEARPRFKIHPPEVKELIEVDVYRFLSADAVSTVKRPVRVWNKEMDVPCYNIDGKIIWGATAMILAEFTELVKRAGEPRD